VGMALFGPELVLFTAYSQYQEARDLVKELNRLRFGDEDGKRKRTKALLGRWLENIKSLFCCGCRQTKVSYYPETSYVHELIKFNFLGVSGEA
jgi:hypothetical protein